MTATTQTGFIEMRIAKVVGFGAPLAATHFLITRASGACSETY